MTDQTAASSGPVFKRVKLLTRPTLPFIEDVTRYVKIEEKIFIGKEIKSVRGRPVDETKPKREPAHVANVLDLTRPLKGGGYEPAQIIVSAVVLGVFNDEYTGDKYVGKCFAITKLPKKAGKEYFGYRVEEIEEPKSSEGETTPPDTVVAKPAVGGKK